jgi:hypothetical protein
MKFNFKKIASVIATTAMLGSTIAFASAALSLPASDYAVVYGADTDNVAALDMAASLVGSGSTVITGDNVKIEKSSDKYSLGQNLNAFISTLDSEDLSKVLADGVYLNDDNNDYEYEQEIALAAEPLIFYHDQDYNDDKPAVGFFMSSGDLVLNYTLDFTTAAECGANMSKCDNTELEMLGKTFFISNAEIASGRIKLTMLDSANVATVDDQNSKTVTLGDKSYEVSVEHVDSTETKLTVNGETTNSLNEGETFKLTDGTFVGIKDISYNQKESGVSKVEFTLGIGKLVIDHGREVKLNDDDISTLEDANGVSSEITGFIGNTSTNIDSITLQWKLDDDAMLAPGADLVMPGFGAIKLAMTGFNAPKAETTTLDDSSDSVRVSTKIKDGDLKMSILYLNSSDTGFAGLGKDSTHKLVTAAQATSMTLTLNETENSYFVVTYIQGDEKETYAYEIQSITEGTDAKNATALNNLAGGADIEFSEVGKDRDVGNINLKLQTANDATKIATINVTSTGSGTVYTDRIVTVEGLTMRLPVDSSAGTDGTIFITNTTAVPNPTSWVMNFTEEDDDGNVDNTESFTVTLGVQAGEGTEPTATSLTSYEEEDDSDWTVGMQTSKLATKVRLYSPSGTSLGKAEVIYAGEESTADVYVSESDSVTSSTSSVAPVKVADLTAADKAKNLIVVGGSCINSVAAKLITGLETPVCGAAFSAKTSVGAGMYMIKGYDSPYATGKIAVLVAGYEAAQTADAVKAAKALTSLTKTTDVVAPKLD